MRDLGYVEGRDFEMLYRYDFQPDRMRLAACEMSAYGPFRRSRRCNIMSEIEG